MSANDRQVGGDHYRLLGEGAAQPWDIIVGYGLGYLDGNAVKYLLRWRHKGGIQDLQKALHYVEKTIEVEQQKQHLLGKTKDGSTTT